MSRTRGSNGALSSNAILEKDKFEEVIRHRFFYALSSEIYGGVAGLYDLGPVGSALESQIIDAWRKHFVYKDGLLEVRSCQLTPYQTLEASGHVDRFTDVLVKDILTGESFRCDHLIKAYFEDLLQDKKLNEEKKTEYINIINQIDNIKKDEMKNIIEKYNISSPITKNKLSQPTDINLMFSTSIGPVDGLSGFLRPETAQGIFVNFKRLLEFNNNRIPMAVAQIGFSFRNEISPRAGLLRCREFLMAEIEHFLHPDKKCHPKFKTVENLNIKLYSAENQLNNNSQQTITLGHAVEKKIIANNVLGYYMGKIYLFLQKIGMDMQRVRFRQHLPNEMAHYACDCWDCEIHSFHGWVECVGCADRACYDLVQHSTKSKQKLIAQENLTTPILIKVHEIVLDKPAIGVRFKGEAKKIIPHIQSFTLEQAEELDETLNNQGFYGIQIDGIQFNLEKNMFKSINFYKKEVFVREYYPHVVEPSFGIGRIMYSLLTHTCKVRENDQQRIWFDIPSCVAPIKCLILPLSNKDEFQPIIDMIIEKLSIHGDIAYRVDDLKASIGKRYSRGDELGIPFAVTIDFDSLKNYPVTITLRDRNSTEQIRSDIDKICHIIYKLIQGKFTWDQVVEKYGLFQGQTLA